MSKQLLSENSWNDSESVSTYRQANHSSVEVNAVAGAETGYANPYLCNAHYCPYTSPSVTLELTKNFVITTS